MRGKTTTKNRGALVRTGLATMLLTCGCVTQRLPIAGREAPVQNVVRASQYAFTTDFALTSDDPMVRDLLGLRQAVTRTLDLSPGRELIRVVVFENQQRYHEFLGINFPELPARRAFFVKQNEDELAVFAFRGDTLQEDLRHEATHALLHSALGQVPIWLDEGLACYFEVGPESHGVNARHIVGLRSRSQENRVDSEELDGRFNLRRLEGLTNLWDMSADDYRESWLWVHFCLNHSESTRLAMLDHLRALRGGRADCLADRLMVLDLPAQALELHLTSLADSVAGQTQHLADVPYESSHTLWQSSWNATRQLLRPLDRGRLRSDKLNGQNQTP